MLPFFQGVLGLSACLAITLSTARASDPTTHDVVVYGATPAGVAAAVGAARQGAKVLLLEPTDHVGGVMTGGLSFSDSNQTDRRALGGLFLEMHRKIAADYQSRGVALPYDVEVKDQTHWTYEPHVAQRVFDQLLAEAKVHVVREVPLVKIEKQGARIAAVSSADQTFRGKQFVDATYEGDLIALAGVSWTLGREGKKQYGESLAGLQFPKPPVKGPNRDADGKLLPLLTAESAGADDGDRHVMVYSFRMCLSADPENRVPLTQPPAYNPDRFALARPLSAGKSPTSVMLDLYPLPGGKSKFDGNNGIGRQISIGLVGAADAWCEASWERRREIWNDHKNYTWEFLWYLQTDPSVPEKIRKQMSELGLAKDEFQQYGHWPPALYVREGRRMIGRYVLTQRDVLDDRAKPDSVGVGSFPIDSHDCQRVAADDGWVNEGTIFPTAFRKPHGHGKPYQVPYRSLTPKADECTNLLAPVALSCSHVAFSSIRVEPTWIVLGHSAGVASALCAKHDLDVQKLPFDQLQPALAAAQQILDIPPERAVPGKGGK